MRKSASAFDCIWFEKEQVPVNGLDNDGRFLKRRWETLETFLERWLVQAGYGQTLQYVSSNHFVFSCDRFGSGLFEKPFLGQDISCCSHGGWWLLCDLFGRLGRIGTPTQLEHIGCFAALYSCNVGSSVGCPFWPFISKRIVTGDLSAAQKSGQFVYVGESKGSWSQNSSMQYLGAGPSFSTHQKLSD